jgi:hypothetical protein
MLRMRARSWTMRDAFADVLRGLQLREEVEDYQGRGGAWPRRTPRGEGNLRADLRRYASPRPSRASRPDDRPIAVSEQVGGRRQDPTIAEPLQESYTLVDADGVVLEVVGAEALRIGFDRMVFNKHLSPDQIVGVWESNEVARSTIERLFGPEALAVSEEHLKSLQSATDPPRDDCPGPAAPSHNAAASNKGRRQDRPLEPDRVLALEINPTWGLQKIFQHYRAALNVLCDSPNRNQPTIARFREANTAVEQRLRSKLPGCMRQIEAIYQSAALEPGSA